jgi:hypothetical protein
MAGMRVERLDHLGNMAGVCQEIGLAAYLDALAGPSQQQVSVGKATLRRTVMTRPSLTHADRI